MWRRLTPAEQAKFLGHALIGSGLIAVSAALAYAALQAGTIWQQLPLVLAQLEKTSERVQPALHEIEAIRNQIPPILKEVKAARELVQPVVAEVKAVREALPPLVATSAAALKDASGAVRSIEPHIPAVLAEVKKTREALPGLLDRADEVAGRAATVGKEAGQGAVHGVIGGIVKSPFRLIGDVRRGMFAALGLGDQAGLTAEDERLAAAATDDVIKTATVGAKQVWRNPDSKNSGSVTLIEQTTRDQTLCLTLRHQVQHASAKIHEAEIDMCRQPDGSWGESKR